MPQYLISQMPGKVILRNFEGVTASYTEPTNYVNDCQCEDCKNQKFEDGIAGLMHSDKISIEPKELIRNKRNHR
jgi:lysine 2,3-aminomutase